MNIRTLVIALAAGVLAATSARAGLSWTLDECRKHYGAEIDASQAQPGRPSYTFTAKGYNIMVGFLDGKVSRIVYAKVDNLRISTGEIDALLRVNVSSDVSWGNSTRKDDQGEFWYEGVQDGKIAFIGGYDPTTLNWSFTRKRMAILSRKVPKTCRQNRFLSLTDTLK